MHVPSSFLFYLPLRNRKPLPTMVARAHGCLKYVVALFSILYIIVGFLLLAGAVYGKSRFVGGDEFGTAVWVGIILGGFLAFIGLLGCCGTLMESVCILGTATVFLFLACSAFAGLAVYMQIELSSAGAQVDIVLKAAMEHYNPEDPSTTIEIDIYQQQLNCCGADSPADWKTTEFYLDSKSTPSSCKANNGTGSEHKAGCTILLSNYVKTTAAYAVRGLAGLSGFLGLGLILSLLLCCVMHRKGL